jgi:hypothetical protein
MNVLIGSFEDERAALDATRAAREAGYSVQDVYTPYAVHGMDEALGLPPSRLPRACFAFGAAGLVGGLALQAWTSAVSWPLNVGGKPALSWPAFIPVAFELTVLCAALGTVALLLVLLRLWPGSRARAVERATDDRFAVALDLRGPFHEEAAARLLRRHGAVETRFAEVDP